jgi:hypothetical protein
MCNGKAVIVSVSFSLKNWFVILRIAMKYHQNMSCTIIIHFSLHSTGLSQAGFHLDVEVINEVDAGRIPLIAVVNDLNFSFLCN